MEAIRSVYDAETEPADFIRRFEYAYRASLEGRALTPAELAEVQHLSEPQLRAAVEAARKDFDMEQRGGVAESQAIEVAKEVEKESIIGDQEKLFGENPKAAGNKNRIIEVTPKIIDHIRHIDPKVPRKRGVGGAHNSEEFFKNDIQVVSRRPHPQIRGVEIIEYYMPQLDGTTYPAKIIPNRYKTGTPKVKTIYDPQVISDQEYILRDVQAANDALLKTNDGKLPHEWIGEDEYGVKWRGYSDDGINPSSFFPDYS